MKISERFYFRQRVSVTDITRWGQIVRKNGRFFNPALAATFFIRTTSPLRMGRRRVAVWGFHLDGLGDRPAIRIHALAAQDARKSAEHAHGHEHCQIFFHFLKLSKSPAIS